MRNVNDNQNNPAYNPYYAPQPLVPGEQQKADIPDDESAFSDDEPSCLSRFCSIFGVWVAFGIIYYVTFTFWGYYQKMDNLELFTWTVCCLFLQICTAMIVLVGIGKGIELGTSSAAKWTTPYCVVIIANIWAHALFGRNRNVYLYYSIGFISCDFISMLYVTAVCYGFHKKFKSFRIINFILEWVDLSSQIVVCLVYSHLTSSKNVTIYENLFWIFILIQLILWVFPILFGSGTTKKTCLRQIFILDMVTDFPLLIINIASGAFLLSIYILVDLVIKILFMGRYAYIFFNYFKHAKLKRNPCEIFKISPFCCNVNDDYDRGFINDLDEY